MRYSSIAKALQWEKTHFFVVVLDQLYFVPWTTILIRLS